MIVSASEKAVKENPERIKLIVDMHRKAVDYAMANQPQIVEMAMQKLGQQKKSIELAVPNVELVWKLDDVFMQRATAYTKLMFENKQIRQMPDLNQPSPSSSCSPTSRIDLERAGHGASGSDAAVHAGSAVGRAPAPAAVRDSSRAVALGVGFPHRADPALAPRRRRDRHAARPEPARSRRDDVRLLVRRHLRRCVQRHHPHACLEVDDSASMAASSWPR